jgi:hypothetical protein
MKRHVMKNEPSNSLIHGYSQKMFGLILKTLQVCSYDGQKVEDLISFLWLERLKSQ